jgi:hypothetical protein
MLKILPVEKPSRKVYAVWAYWLTLSRGSKAKTREHSAASRLTTTTPRDFRLHRTNYSHLQKHIQARSVRNTHLSPWHRRRQTGRLRTQRSATLSDRLKQTSVSNINFH